MNDYDILQAMTKYGGSFICSLANTARHADEFNLKRLKEAFPEYWKQYEEMAEMDKEKAKL